MRDNGGMQDWLRPDTCLPRDQSDPLLVGRVWNPGAGPTLVRIHEGTIRDLSSVAATASELLNLADPAGAVRSADRLPVLGTLEAALANSYRDRPHAAGPALLAPC